MRAAAKIGLMIAAIVDAGKRAIAGEKDYRQDNRRRNKVARFKSGASYQQRLRAKFAKNALERYGLDITYADEMESVVVDHRRVMRNARKQERRSA